MNQALRKRARRAGSLGWLLAIAGLILAPGIRATQQSGNTGPVLLPRTEVRLLSAAASGVTYKLYVSLPPGYAKGTSRYPVVVLLDADYSFGIARNITEHLSDRGDLQETILIGVGYGGPDRYRLHRTRDYTPTHVATGGYGPEYQKVSGGAPAFRDLLAKRILPFVDRSYRTIPGDRTLVGHSYGGLFGSFVLFTKPELFSRYVLVSPSLWYDNRVAFGIEKTFRESHSALPARVYWAVGEREINETRSMVADLENFVGQVEGHEYASLVSRRETLDNETHNSVFPRALSNGLRFVFEAR